MARRKQTRGNCVYCGREFAKGGLTRHIKTCEARQQAQAEANKGNGRSQTLYHLQVQDAWSGDYWLHLEMRGDADLIVLDDYLRAIWLECCGHLSAFHIGDHRYTQIFDTGWSIGDEKAMGVPVKKLFTPDMAIPYEYDFGTTSELTIKVLDEREGKPTTSHPIALMARNNAPDILCVECGNPATSICLECLYEEDDEACEYCDKHMETHRHDSENYGGPMPILNSPRTGMCGYGGPAEPPY